LRAAKSSSSWWAESAKLGLMELGSAVASMWRCLESRNEVTLLLLSYLGTERGRCGGRPQCEQCPRLPLSGSDGIQPVPRQDSTRREGASPTHGEGEWGDVGERRPEDDEAGEDKLMRQRRTWVVGTGRWRQEETLRRRAVDLPVEGERRIGGETAGDSVSSLVNPRAKSGVTRHDGKGKERERERESHRHRREWRAGTISPLPPNGSSTNAAQRHSLTADAPRISAA
jgi:hypothetical protein